MAEAARTAAAYGLAHSGKSLLWGFFINYFMYFAIFGVGLDPFQASLILTLFVVSDIIVDLVVAAALQRWGMSGAGMVRWVSIATPLAAVALVFLFAPHIVLTGAPKSLPVATLLTAGLIFRAAFSLIDVPLNAAIGRFTYSSRMRNLGSAMRSVGGFSAGLAIGLVTAALLEPGGRLAPERFWMGATVMAICAVPLILLGFARVDRKARVLEAAIAAAHRNRSRASAGAYVTPALVALTATNIVFLLAATQLDDAFIYLSQGAWPDGPAFSLIAVTVSLAHVCGAGLWLWLATRWEKRTVTWASLAALGLATALFPLLPKTTIALLSFAFVLALSSGTNALIWSLLPDLVDEASARSGKPAHALIVGVFALIGKLSIAASQLLSGALLTVSGFPADPNYGQYALLVIACSLAGIALSALPLVFVRISHARHASVALSLLRERPPGDSTRT